jgi:cytochrome c-type biogenesis protein CcmH
MPRQAVVALVVAVAFAFAAVPGVAAKEAAPEAADPALEARMVRIASELRCLVCQNQTIADSNASLAVDLRREARALLKQGKSDEEVVAYMTARYGDFVLYRPPLKATTMLLWFGPAVMLLGGGAVLVVVLRRRGRMNADAFDRDDDEAIVNDAGAAVDDPAAAVGARADASAARALGQS